MRIFTCPKCMTSALWVSKLEIVVHQWGLQKQGNTDVHCRKWKFVWINIQKAVWMEQKTILSEESPRVNLKYDATHIDGNVKKSKWLCFSHLLAHNNHIRKGGREMIRGNKTNEQQDKLVAKSDYRWPLMACRGSGNMTSSSLCPWDPISKQAID